MVRWRQAPGTLIEALIPPTHVVKGLLPDNTQKSTGDSMSPLCLWNTPTKHTHRHPNPPPHCRLAMTFKLKPLHSEEPPQHRNQTASVQFLLSFVLFRVSLLRRRFHSDLNQRRQLAHYAGWLRCAHAGPAFIQQR